MLSNQIRQTFLDYFKKNGHEIVSSSSLIPHGDKTILFTNAGMNQFKNLFLGVENRGYNRAVTSQKVMRVSGKHNDLENVGPSQRHHTFFEMLGNFSFGDYFKDDAMKFALELLTKEYGLDIERMWFTIYTDDDEAERLWIKNGVRPDRILRFGEKENFWRMGETGPCGPCSEIHYFVGEDMRDNTAHWVNNDDTPDGVERCVEIWNLVFMQYEQGASGVTPLPKPSIDTGMGFERLVRVLQGKSNNYDTDLFSDTMDCVQELAHQTDEQRAKQYVAYRVIADHARAASFLIGDGVLPGNEGRNYVLRMVMRRAMRFGRELGLHDPFLFQVADAVIQKMGGYYTDLVARREHILNTIKSEEERFARTLDAGLARLDEVIKESAHNLISGEAAFKLYDTYGLPVEITRDIAKANGMNVDEDGFVAAREAAKEVARSAGKENFAGNFDAVRAYREAFDSLIAEGALPASGVNYNPYGTVHGESKVLAILRDGEMTDRAVAGESVDMVLRDTAFYVESGGQVSDTGVITSTNAAAFGWSAQVQDTVRPIAGFVVHRCVVQAGQPEVNTACVYHVDEARRAAIQRNHTATHILQAGLRRTLGTHVAQQGSSVTAERLRFDFSHGAPLTHEQLEQVTQWMNEQILADQTVWDKQENYKDATAGGAMALFSEKYGDVVRVVRIGSLDGNVMSAELCGGTHVRSTGQIGGAMIVSEGAVAAGVRRIEVITGMGLLALARQQQQQLGQMAHSLNATPETVAEQVTKLTHQLSDTQKQLDTARSKLAKIEFSAVVRQQATTTNGAGKLVAQVNANSPDALREMSDWFREQYASGVAVLGAVINDKPSLLVSVSADLNKKGYEAGKLIKEIAAVVGGGGGGKPTLAQAGGKDASKLSEALAKAEQLLAGL